ncbi:hypothetical protein S245_058870, partial [Arachis hypogaea]
VLVFVKIENKQLNHFDSEGVVLVIEKGSNDVAQLSSSASYNSSQFDENTKLKFAISGFIHFGWRL